VSGVADLVSGGLLLLGALSCLLGAIGLVRLPSMLSRLQTLPGFTRLSLVVDRKQGRIVSVTSFDSAASCEQTRKPARGFREEFAQAVGARITDVAEMDVVVAHLHVPDNA